MELLVLQWARYVRLLANDHDGMLAAGCAVYATDANSAASKFSSQHCRVIRVTALYARTLHLPLLYIHIRSMSLVILEMDM